MGARQSANATEVGYNRKFGLGFMLGDPTGITGKYWVSGTNALDFGLGFTDYGFGYGTCYTDNANVTHCSGYYDTSVHVEAGPFGRPAGLVYRRRRPRLLLGRPQLR
jgi:hypothetical protein